MDTQSALFIILSLTLINAGLAQCKGRSGLVWWAISAFIGPVATFLIVILPALHATPPGRVK